MGTSNFSGDDKQNQTGESIRPILPSLNIELCLVCGDRASGRHYGAVSCEGCKGFFKRSIRKQLGYHCRGAMNCEVTKHHRNRCQFCRLQKCLASGMRSDSVQHERKPIVDKKDMSSSCNNNLPTSCAPVYQQRTKQIFNHNPNISSPSARLSKKNLGATVFPIGLKFAELTQSLMLATQQHRLPTRKSNQSLADATEIQRVNDEDSSDQNRSECVNELSFPSEAKYFCSTTMDPAIIPSTTIGYVQSSLDKEAIDYAFQQLIPIQKYIKRMSLNMNSGPNLLNLKSEMDTEESEFDNNFPERVFKYRDDGSNFLETDNLNKKKYSLEMNVLDSELMSQRQVGFNLQTPTLIAPYWNSHYVCEIGSRIVFLSVYWLRNISAFHQLDEQIQVKLIRRSWSSLLIVAAAQIRNLSLPTFFSTFINYIRQLTDNEKIDALKVHKLSEHITVLHNFIQEMHVYDVTDMEYALLRLIIVFNPLVLLSREDTNARSYVHRVQSQALSLLRQHTTEQTVGEDRFNTLVINVMSLYALRSELIEELFFNNIIGAIRIDNMVPYILNLIFNTCM